MVVLDAVADFLLGEKPPFFRPSISADLLPEREPLLGGEEGGDRGSSGEESNDCGCGAHQETGELGRRLKAAHASVGVLTCSLMWPKTVGLLGLHCCTPTGQHIHFGRREADCGGTMDVDSVSAGWPVENISWSSSPPPGRYTFWVESAGDGGDRNVEVGGSSVPGGDGEVTPYTVRLSFDGATHEKSFDAIGPREQPVAFEIDVDDDGRDAGARIKAEDGMPPPPEGFGALIVVNVYDLLPPNGASEVMWLLGLGLHHSAVEIYGREWCFGGHEFAFSGVFECEPRAAAGVAWRESICVGRTHLADAQAVRSYIEEYAQTEWPGHCYSLTGRNCNHFTTALCQRMLGRQCRVPGYINRLAYLGELKAIKYFLPVEMTSSPSAAPVSAAAQPGFNQQQQPQNIEEARAMAEELQLRKVITQHYGPDSLSEAQIQTVIAQLKAQRAQLETQHPGQELEIKIQQQQPAVASSTL